MRCSKPRRDEPSRDELRRAKSSRDETRRDETSHDEPSRDENVDEGSGLNRYGLGDQIGQVIDTVVMKFKSYQSDVNLKRLCQDVVKIYMKVCKVVKS